MQREVEKVKELSLELQYSNEKNNELGLRINDLENERYWNKLE